jgi:hypothetical protein
MPECWFSMLPDAGPCDGRLRQCHLLPKNKIAQEFPRGAWRSQGESSWRPLGRDDDLRLDALAPVGEFMPTRGLQDDPRCWVWGCGGPMGPGGHHGQFKPDGPRPIARHRLPPALEEFAEEIGLSWWLDYTYGPRWDDEAERAAREAHDDVPLP